MFRLDEHGKVINSNGFFFLRNKGWILDLSDNNATVMLKNLSNLCLTISKGGYLALAECFPVPFISLSIPIIDTWTGALAD